MHIEFVNKYKINNNFISANIRLEPSGCYLLCGENGIGKTTFFHYLKLNSDQSNNHNVFLDQPRFEPLNDVSFNHCLRILSTRRVEENPLFEEALARIDSYKANSIKSLSGGQNQMIKIALMLFLGGDLFLLDEPLQHLDKENMFFLKEIMMKLKAQKKTVLLIEHKNEFLADIIDGHIDFCFKEEGDVIIQNRSGTQV